MGKISRSTLFGVCYAAMNGQADGLSRDSEQFPRLSGVGPALLGRSRLRAPPAGLPSQLPTYTSRRSFWVPHSLMRTPSSHTLSWARDPLPPHKYLSGFFQAFTIKTVRTECEFIKSGPKAVKPKKGTARTRATAKGSLGTVRPGLGSTRAQRLGPAAPCSALPPGTALASLSSSSAPA